MRLLLPVLAIAILVGCAGRADVAAIQQRTHDQVLASKDRISPAVGSPAEHDALVRQIKQAKHDLYLLSIADADDPAVAAAQTVIAARLGALTGYMDAMGLEVPGDAR